MKIKWILMIMWMVMLSGTSIAATQIEISGDNVSWKSIDSTYYGGNIDDTNNWGRANTLNSSTTYYFRIKNDTTSWYYGSTTTKGGIDIEVAYVLAVGLLAFFFLYFAFQLGQEHFLLKLFLIFMSLASIIALPAALVVNSGNNAIVVITKIATWTFRIFLTYFCIYLFWHWAKKSEKFMNFFSTVKNGKK